MKRNAKNNPVVVIKNLSAVLDYLKDAGWKVEKTKLYDDKNKIPKQKNGHYLQADIDEYARMNLLRLDGSDTNTTASSQKKLDLEIAIAEEKLKEARRDNEIEAGKYILKSEAEQQHNAKLALFLTSLDNYIDSGPLEKAAEIIKGSRELMPEFKGAVKKEIRAMLAEYAKAPVFHVPKKAVEDAEKFKEEIFDAP